MSSNILMYGMRMDEPQMMSPSLQRMSSFFEQVYANYNKLWQDIIKTPGINGDCVPVCSFINVLTNSSVPVYDPYCLFLLDTCMVTSDRGSSNRKTSHSKSNLIEEEKQIDFRLFLNTSIKEKISNFERPFCDESFIVDHFWRSSFPNTSSSMDSYLGQPGSINPSPVNQQLHKVSLDAFNHAFNKFFNRDTKLLQIDQIELILNECFQYLLLKNKKSISKRNFKKVINRSFKFLFPMIIHQYHQKSADQQASILADRQNVIHTSLQKQYLQQESANKSEILSNQCYPDSLDTRCGSQKHSLRFGSHEGDVIIRGEVYHTSSFTAHRVNNSVSECMPALDITSQEMDGVFKLFSTLAMIKDRISLQRALKVMKRRTMRKQMHPSLNDFQNSQDKENQRPQMRDANQKLISNSKSRIANRNPLSQKQTTFSFNNTSNLHDDENYQSHQKLHHYDPYQEEPIFKVEQLNYSHKGSNQQSIGSLAISNTSQKDQNCFTNLSSVKGDQPPIILQFSNSNQDLPFSNKSTVRDYSKPPIDLQYHQNLYQQNHEGQMKKSETYRFSNQDTTINTVDQNGSHITNDQDMSGYMIKGGNYTSVIHEDMRSFTNATASSRRQSSSQLVHSVPPFSGREQKRSSRKKHSAVKYASTPKIMINQSADHLISDYSQKRDSNKQPYQNHNSTLDYSNLPEYQRRPLSLQHRNERQKRHLSNDPQYYETRYRNSRSRCKKIISQMNGERSLNNDLSQQVAELTTRIQSLEKAKYRSQRKNVQRAVKVIKIARLRLLKANVFHQLCKLASKRAIIRNERVKYYDRNRKSKLFQKWVIYVLNRKTRKERRVIFKFKIKTLRRLFLKVPKAAKINSAFQKWKGYTQQFGRLESENKRIISQVQKDIHFANKQMRSMRMILGLTKLIKMTDGREKLLKSHGFQSIYHSSLKSLQQSMHVRSKYPTLNTISNHQFGRNTSNSLIGKRDYGRNDKLVGIQTLSLKASKQRLQHRIIGGIEKLYQVVKRHEGNKRRRFFQRWSYLAYDAIVGQLDISNEQYNNIVIHPYQTAIFSNTCHPQRSTSLNQPSFYKTNEGFFSAEQEPRRMQSTTIVFSPSPKGVHTISFNHNSDTISLQNTSHLEMPLIAPQPHPLMKTVPYLSSGEKSRARSISSSQKQVYIKNQRQPYHQQKKTKFRDNSQERNIKVADHRNEFSYHTDDKNQLNEALAYLKAKIGKGI